MLLTKADEKTNTVITINSSGIWYQELLTSDRPQSPRVKIGMLDMVEGEIMANYVSWDCYNALIFKRRTTEVEIKIVKSRILDYYKILGMPQEMSNDQEVAKFVKDLAKQFHPDSGSGNTEKMAEINDARDQLKALHKKFLDLQIALENFDGAIDAAPIGKLTTLNGKVHERVNKLITSASFKNKYKETSKGIVFQPLQTLEAFMESQAKDLVKRHNDHLEATKATTGFLDIETARDIIASRFDRAAKRLEARLAAI